MSHLVSAQSADEMVLQLIDGSDHSKGLHVNHGTFGLDVDLVLGPGNATPIARGWTLTGPSHRVQARPSFHTFASSGEWIVHTKRFAIGGRQDTDGRPQMTAKASPTDDATHLSFMHGARDLSSCMLEWCEDRSHIRVLSLDASVPSSEPHALHAPRPVFDVRAIDRGDGDSVPLTVMRTACAVCVTELFGSKVLYMSRDDPYNGLGILGMYGCEMLSLTEIVCIWVQGTVSVMDTRHPKLVSDVPPPPGNDWWSAAIQPRGTDIFIAGITMESGHRSCRTLMRVDLRTMTSERVHMINDGLAGYYSVLPHGNRSPVVMYTDMDRSTHTVVA